VTRGGGLAALADLHLELLWVAVGMVGACV
jgi:hypothetical protein